MHNTLGSCMQYNYCAKMSMKTAAKMVYGYDTSKQNKTLVCSSSTYVLQEMQMSVHYSSWERCSRATFTGPSDTLVLGYSVSRHHHASANIGSAGDFTTWHDDNHSVRLRASPYLRAQKGSLREKRLLEVEELFCHFFHRFL